MIMTRFMFPHFHSKSCVNLKFHAATKRLWRFEYKRQRVESWRVLSSKVLFVSSGFSNGLCVRGVVSPPSRVGKGQCHCRHSEDDDFTVVWRYNKAVSPVKGPPVPLWGEEESTCRGYRIMAELHVQAAVSAVLQHPLLKGHPSVSFTLLKCCYQIEPNHLHSNSSTAIHSG